MKVRISGRRRAAALVMLALVCAASPAAHAAPANDAFADAEAVGAPSIATGSSAGAGTELDEPQPSCGGGSVGATIWYRVAVPDATVLKLSTFGSKFDTVLAAYTGSAIESLTEVGCNDDDESVGSQQSRLNVRRVGPLVFVKIGGFGGASGTTKLTI